MSNPHLPNWMYDVNEQDRLDRLAEQQQHSLLDGWLGLLALIASAVVTVWAAVSTLKLLKWWPL